MEVEYEVKVLPIDENLGTEAEKLAKDGWSVAPGFKPVAVYYLVRSKQVQQQPQPPSFGAMGEMIIDDSKVFVIPASKLKN